MKRQFTLGGVMVAMLVALVLRYVPVIEKGGLKILSIGDTVMRAWFLMLCLGFVIATSLEVTAAPNNDAEIKKCEGSFDACNRGCSDPSQSPEAAAKCKSDCNQRYQIHCDSSGACACKTGLAIKPSNKLPQLQPMPGGQLQGAPSNPPSRTSPKPKAGVNRRGVEGEQQDPGMANPSGTGAESK